MRETKGQDREEQRRPTLEDMIEENLPKNVVSKLSPLILLLREESREGLYRKRNGLHNGSEAGKNSFCSQNSKKTRVTGAESLNGEITGAGTRSFRAGRSAGTALSCQPPSLVQQEKWKESKRGSRADEQMEAWGEFQTTFILGLPQRNHHILETLWKERSACMKDKDFNSVKGDAWEVQFLGTSLSPKEKYHSPAWWKERAFLVFGFPSIF